MLINDRSSFKKAIQHIKKYDELTVDTETTGLNPWSGDRIAGIAILAGDDGFYLPFKHGSGINLPMAAMDELNPFLCNPNVNYIGFNYKFDLEMMFVDGIPICEHMEDPMLAAHLMNENEENFKLEYLAEKYLGNSESKKEMACKLGEIGIGKGDMWKLPPEQVESYAIGDVVLTRDLRDFYVPYLKAWRLYDLWKKEGGTNDYSLAVTRMECYGMMMNVPLIHKYMLEAGPNADAAEAKLQEMAGYAINPRSPKQLSAWTGLKSTAKEIIEYIDEPWAHTLMDYRQWARVNTNYYKKFLMFKETDTDILHPNMHMTGTISGRLSASKPPMQAIPRHTNKYKVKDVFIARPGYILVSCDYSQVEMRLATHYAKEETMAVILNSGGDIHDATAKEMGVKDRRVAKAINFGVIYGIGAPSLSEQLRITRRKAQEFLNKYHGRFPGFKRLFNKAEAMAEMRGYIRMWTGRIRHYNLSFKTPSRKAMSNIIQGGVGEIMRVAITRLDRHFRNDPVYMLLQVHDDIIFEVKEEILYTAVPEIKEIMEDFDFSIPIIVDVKVGKNWGDMVKWQEYMDDAAKVEELEVAHK